MKLLINIERRKCLLLLDSLLLFNNNMDPSFTNLFFLRQLDNIYQYFIPLSRIWQTFKLISPFKVLMACEIRLWEIAWKSDISLSLPLRLSEWTGSISSIWAMFLFYFINSKCLYKDRKVGIKKTSTFHIRTQITIRGQT